MKYVSINFKANYRYVLLTMITQRIICVVPIKSKRIRFPGVYYMHSSVSFLCLSIGHFALSSCSTFNLLEQSLVDFCNSSQKEECIARIREDVIAYDYLLENTIWPKLVSCDFEVESIQLDADMQLIIYDALKGNASQLKALYKIRPIEYVFEPRDHMALEIFFKNQDLLGIPLRLSGSQKSLELLREYFDDYVGVNNCEYDFGALVKPFKNAIYNELFLSMREWKASLCSFESVPVESDEELHFILDEMLLLKPYKARNFLKLFSLRQFPSPFSVEKNIDWNSVSVKKEVLRSLWQNRVQRGDYLLVMNLPFYQKIERLKTHLFGPHFIWTYVSTKQVKATLNGNVMTENKTAFWPLPVSRALHNQLSLYFSLFRYELWDASDNQIYSVGSFERLRFAHYNPLERAFRGLFLENSEYSEGERKIWQTIFNGTFKIGHRHRTSDWRKTVERLNFENPLMLEVFSTNHVGAVVVRGSRLWLCDRAQPADSVIVEYHLHSQYDNLECLKKVVQTVLTLPLHVIQQGINSLVDTMYYETGRIPLGIQYTENCTLQAWLMGLRCVFKSMGVPHEKYQLLTGMAREMVWSDALGAVKKDPSYKLPLLMAHLMQPEGQYEIKGLFEITPELLLVARKAFFFPFNHLHTYETELGDSNVQSVLNDKRKSLKETRTNGDVLLRSILVSGDDAGFHPYLRILAMCLLEQGNGVSDYLNTLSSQNDAVVIFDEIREYALETDFTLINAVIYSASRYDSKVKSSAFECIWELTFGSNWQEYRPDILSIERSLPFIELEDNPSAKALFYASLLLPYCQDYDSNLAELASKLTSDMLLEFPALRYFSVIVRGQSFVPIPFDFPYLFLLRDNSQITLKFSN